MKEFQLLKHIYASTQTHVDPRHIGPGDDMAQVIFDKQRLLLGVDQLVVGKHVTAQTPPELIGRKAVARSFSDIAAMGGTPVASLMTAALPPNTDDAWSQAVFNGAREVAEQWGGPIVGGDIAATEDAASAVFSVTAIASAPRCDSIRRNTAVLNDNVYITGTLGNSLAQHHLRFVPRIQEAKALLKAVQIHAMIDVSDGLGQDASHLATAELQLVINPSLLPLREGASIDSAIADGEDYELLFCCDEIPPKQLLDCPVTKIGHVQRRSLDEPGVVDKAGNDLSSLGWRHES